MAAVGGGYSGSRPPPPPRMSLAATPTPGNSSGRQAPNRGPWRPKEVSVSRIAPKRKNAGIASLTEAARHWQTTPETAKAILEARGIRDTGLRARPSYRWKDIWRVEGSPDVPEALWDEYREPLLTPDDLGGIMPEKDARTIRRELEAARWPVIQLSERVRRVRARDLAHEMEVRAGNRAVRRKPARSPDADA